MWKNIPLFPESASTVAGDVDSLFLFSVAVSAISTLLISIGIIVLASKYRRRFAAEVGHREHAPEWLEIVWSVIPLVILMFLFVWGARVFFTLNRPPANATEYYAIGRQWMWKFQHPEGNREINDLHVPAGRPIKIKMTSEDVIHSFFVPAFRVKSDVVPGRYTSVWFEATKPGTYHLFCAEYCGVEHSRMGGKIVVMEPDAYEAWLAGSATAGATVQAAGEKLFNQFACSTCHRPGAPTAAPPLAGLYGREVDLLGGGTVTADEDYLRRSILDPAEHIVDGYQPVMPTYKGQMDEEQLLQLITYIKKLPEAQRDGSAATAAAGKQG